MILDAAPPNARRFVHKKLIGPPLGLLTVAGTVPDHDVRLLELKGEYDLHPDAPPVDVLVRLAMLEDPPDMVGVTFIASEFEYGIEIFRAVKSVNPDIVTVAGGLHVTLCPQEFENPVVDILVQGPAVRSFPELVRAIEAGRSPQSVGGVWSRVDGRLVRSPVRAEFVDEAGRDFVLPARHLIEPWKSTYTVGSDPRIVTYVYSSLGCTARCSFCSIWPQNGGRYLQRDVDSLLAEIDSLDDYEVIRFADANTLVDVRWMERLMDGLQANGIKKFYIMDLRMDMAAKHPRLIERMAKNGLAVVITGIESVRVEELRRYNKHQALTEVEEGLNICHAHGLLMRANYVIPPDWREDDFKALGDYAEAHSTAYAGYTILTPMPGTAFYDEVKDQIVDFDLKKYNFFNNVMRTALPPDQFVEQVGSLWRIRDGDRVLS